MKSNTSLVRAALAVLIAFLSHSALAQYPRISSSVQS
jgi:hypothetical protein